MPTYVTIKNERIEQVQCSNGEYEAPPGWIRVPDNFKGTTGDHVDWFTEDMIRIPDEKLIGTGKRFDKRGRWYSKKTIGQVWDISQLDIAPGQDWTNLPPLEKEPFQKWDENNEQWVIDKKAKITFENMTFLEHLDTNNIELPGFLYHYTSLENFIKILDSKTFFMFNSSQMNDYKENFAIFDALNRVIHDKKSIIPDDYLRKLNEVLEMKFKMGFSFISCFTELRDSISQWRSYGDDGNGICLIINPRDIGINYSLPSHNAYIEKCISFHNVIYSNEKQDKIIKEILDYSLLLSNSNKKYKAESFAEYVYMFITRFAPIFKINEFQEEKEWRIFYTTIMSEQTSLGILTSDARYDIDFIHTRNNLKSYFPLKIDKARFLNSITGIILGPKSMIPYMEISAFLKKKGFRNTQVIYSKIPYR